MSLPTNGSGGERRILYWICGALAALLVAATGTAVASLNSRVDRLEGGASARAERVRALEVSDEGVTQRLARIEGKIDDLVKAVATSGR
ncbi:MAG: hypothetical protein ABIK89_05020 [Planctomycetota bacterium]